MAVGALAPLQVVVRALALGTERARIPAGGHEALHRPGRRLRVRRGAAGQRPSPGSVLGRTQPLDGRLDLLVAAGGGGERLDDRTGAVGLADGPGDRTPAAVLVLDPPQPLRGLGELRALDLGRPLGEDRVGGQVDLLLVGAVTVAAVAQLLDEVAAAEVARLDAGSDEGDDRPLQVAGRGDRGDVTSQVGDRGVAAATDVERVDPGGLESEHRPTRHPDARVGARLGPVAPVPVLGRTQPLRRRRLPAAGLSGRWREQRCGQAQGERYAGGDPPDRTVAPVELEPVAIAVEHAHECRAGGEHQCEVTRCMDDIERYSTGGERQIAVE